jgi:putative peptidoglycan lipid II flippase
MSDGGPREAPIHAIARSALLLSGLGLLAMACTMAWHLALAALFGASGRLDGFWIAYSVPKALVDSLHLGILSFVFILVWRLAPDRIERSRLTAALVNWTLLITIGVMAIVAVGAGTIVRVMGPGLAAPDQAHAATMMRWLSLMLLPSAISGFVGGALYAEGRFAAFSWARVLSPAVQVAVLTALAAGLGDAAPMWAALAGPLAMGAVCLVLLRRLPIVWSPTLRLSGAEARFVFHVFLVLCAFAVLERANQASDRFFATLVGPGALSALEFAWRLEIPVSQLLSLAVGIPTFVLMTEAARHRRPGEMLAIVAANLRLIMIAVVPLIGFIVALRAPLIHLLFVRGAFTDASAAVLIALVPALGVMFTVRACGVVMVLGFLATGRTTGLMVVLALEVALNTAMNWMLVASYGLPGIVTATAAAMVASNVVLWRHFRTVLGDAAGPRLLPRLARPAAAGAVSVGVVWIAHAALSRWLRAIEAPDLAVVGAFGLLFAAVHLVAAHRLGVLDVLPARRGELPAQ